MPRTHGYGPKGERVFGIHDWHAKGRTNVIGALLGGGCSPAGFAHSMWMAMFSIIGSNMTLSQSCHRAVFWSWTMPHSTNAQISNRQSQMQDTHSNLCPHTLQTSILSSINGHRLKPSDEKQGKRSRKYSKKNFESVLSRLAI